MNKIKVFISYANEDIDIAKRLSCDLKNNSLIPWLKDESILPGKNRKQEIKKAIKECSYFLALISSNSISKRGFVHKEQKWALEILEESPLNKTFFIPIKLDKCELPDERLKGLHWIDIYSSYKEGLRQLLCVLLPEKSDNNKKSNKLLSKNNKYKNHLREMDYMKSNYFIIFGYLSLKVDSNEKVLVYIDENDPMQTYRFPIVEIVKIGNVSIEDAAGVKIRKALKNIGIDEGELQKSNFSKPCYKKIHGIKIEADRRDTIYSLPFYFFNIKLEKEIKPKIISYKWELKSSVTKQWICNDFIQMVSHDKLCRITDQSIEKYKMNLLEIINNDWISEEIDFKVLECVDTIIFLIDKNKEIKYLMIYRDRAFDKGWEYPKGGLYYHESYQEGALREIEEETGISPNNLKYCSYLGWQTVNVQYRKEFYDTLRVHGLVFYYSGDPDNIRLDPKHTKYSWKAFDEAKESIWMKNYGPEFFERWKNIKDNVIRNLDNE